jgi:hypothetical protein
MWCCAGVCLKGLTATAGWLVSRLKLKPGRYKCQVVLLAAPAWTFSSNIHWTEQCCPVNITALHAWDTVLDQCGEMSFPDEGFCSSWWLSPGKLPEQYISIVLLILMLLSQNIHKHLQSVLNKLYSSYHQQRITISRSGLVEWYIMRLCTALQGLISGSEFATIYSVVKQNVAHMSIQNLLLCWSLKSFCLYWSLKN